MTDEGQTGTPMDAVELAHAMLGMGTVTRRFYEALRDEGFTPDEAMKLTQTWLFGTAGGRQA